MSRIGWVLTGLVVLGVSLWGVSQSWRTPSGSGDRGPVGIDFVVPPDYRVVELGESTPAAAADRLLESLSRRERVAAVFTFRGDRVQWLADPVRDLLDERVLGRNGTVRRILWPDSLGVRLAWAGAEGTLDAPGLPSPDRRNPYH